MIIYHISDKTLKTVSLNRAITPWLTNGKVKFNYNYKNLSTNFPLTISDCVKNVEAEARTINHNSTQVLN